MHTAHHKISPMRACDCDSFPSEDIISLSHMSMKASIEVHGNKL